jgi:hypothetical protein
VVTGPRSELRSSGQKHKGSGAKSGQLSGQSDTGNTRGGAARSAHRGVQPWGASSRHRGRTAEDREASAHYRYLQSNIPSHTRRMFLMAKNRLSTQRDAVGLLFESRSTHRLSLLANTGIVPRLEHDRSPLKVPRDRRSSPGRVKNFLFSTSSRPVLGSTQPLIQCAPGALSPGRDADHSSLTSAEVKKTCICTSTLPCLHGVVFNWLNTRTNVPVPRKTIHLHKIYYGFNIKTF